ACLSRELPATGRWNGPRAGKQMKGQPPEHTDSDQQAQGCPEPPGGSARRCRGGRQDLDGAAAGTAQPGPRLVIWNLKADATMATAGARHGSSPGRMGGPPLRKRLRMSARTWSVTAFP